MAARSFGRPQPLDPDRGRRNTAIQNRERAHQPLTAVRVPGPAAVLGAIAANYPGMNVEPGEGLFHRDPGALDAAEEVTERGVREALAAHPHLRIAGATEVQKNIILTGHIADSLLTVVSPTTLGKELAKTGITVNYDVFDSNELVEAKLLAGNSGYDVVVPSGFFLERQIAADRNPTGRGQSLAHAGRRAVRHWIARRGLRRRARLACHVCLLRHLHPRARPWLDAPRPAPRRAPRPRC